jgi:toxin ParE1/3/4
VKSRVELTARAEVDLEGIGDHIALDNPRRAASFVRELRVRCFGLDDQPRAGRSREELGPGIRAAVHGSYLILYVERQGVVVIERVVHGARDLDALDP